MAQLVEHNLAKVGVAGSNPVVRSRKSPGGRGLGGELEVGELEVGELAGVPTACL